MYIIEDTRNKPGKHDAKRLHFISSGDVLMRSKLPFGDYALMPSVSVDTKKNIYELAQDIDEDHARFRNELIGARDHGCKLIILVENTDGVSDLETLAAWNESNDHYAMRLAKNRKARLITGARLSKSCVTMAARYDAQFMFCKPEDAGGIIRGLLGGG